MIKLEHNSTDKGFILEEINDKLIKKGEVKPLETEKVTNDPESVEKHIEAAKKKAEDEIKEVEKVALETKSEDRAVFAESIKFKNRAELSTFLSKLREQKIRRRVIPMKEDAEGYRFEVQFERPLVESVVTEAEKEEPKKEEPKLETFDEQMDFLAKDEQEAIDGYEKVLGLVEDAHVKEQLEKILVEEKAHKAFLEAVKSDMSLEYSHEEHEEEKKDEVKEPEEKSEIVIPDEWNFEEEDKLAEEMIAKEGLVEEYVPDASDDDVTITVEENKELNENLSFTHDGSMWDFGDEE